MATSATAALGAGQSPAPCVLAGGGEGGDHGYDLLVMEDTEGVSFVAVGLRVRAGGFMMARGLANS